MPKAYALVMMIIMSTKCIAAHPRSYGHHLNQAMAIFAIATLSLAMAENIADGDDVKCTLYFIYVSTWLGNILGIFDVSGWLIDWLANGIFYRKKDLPEVRELRANLEELKILRQEKYKLAAKLCDIAINDIASDNIDHIHEYFFLIKQAIEWHKHDDHD